MICSAAENCGSLIVSFGLLTGSDRTQQVSLREEKALGTRPRFRLLQTIPCALAFQHMPRRFIPVLN
jgi:hypothetical protein